MAAFSSSEAYCTPPAPPGTQGFLIDRRLSSLILFTLVHRRLYNTVNAPRPPTHPHMPPQTEPNDKAMDKAPKPKLQTTLASRSLLASHRHTDTPHGRATSYVLIRGAHASAITVFTPHHNDTFTDTKPRRTVQYRLQARGHSTGGRLLTSVCAREKCSAYACYPCRTTHITRHLTTPTFPCPSRVVHLSRPGGICDRRPTLELD